MPEKGLSMILGIGSDLIEIERIELIFNRHGKRFLNRVFTPKEIAYAQDKLNMSASLANRFAAKEAMVKALGTGISQGIRWQDIEVQNTPKGQPYISLYNRAAEILKERTPEGLSSKVFCSLSHSQNYALAMVVIEATSC
jgi:holo-[acyl-carrier protein] synthase